MSHGLEGRSIENLMRAFKNDQTEENYLIKLRMFFASCGLAPDEFADLAKKDPVKAERLVSSYIQERKGQVSGHTIRIFRVALRLFLSMNDCDTLNWVRIGKIVPPTRRYGSDRAPTIDELRKILDSCDLRMKCVVLVLISSGARIGAFDSLQWRDLQPVRLGNYEFAKLAVYRGENEQYHSFVTPECYRYLLEYRDMRAKASEQLRPESPLIRDDWGTYKGAKDPSKAAPVTSKTLRDQLGRLYTRIGLRPDKEGLRHEFQQVHGFRKFFKTRMEVAGVRPIITELLMGHSIGVSNSYMKPSNDELVAEYAKGIPALTVLHQEKANVKSELKEQLLLVAGFKPEEIEKIKFAETSDEDFQKMVREKLLGAMANNGNRQKVVPLDEVKGLIPQGWEYVTQLPTGEAIVKLPS
ncbi:MAG: site-specific integrase [Nitrososphaerales archaeon]|jgi:integrase